MAIIQAPPQGILHNQAIEQFPSTYFRALNHEHISGRFRTPGIDGETEHWLHFERTNDLNVTDSVNKYEKESDRTVRMGEFLFRHHYPDATEEEVNEYGRTVRTIAVNTGLLEEAGVVLVRMAQMPPVEHLKASVYLVKRYARQPAT